MEKLSNLLQNRTGITNLQCTSQPKWAVELREKYQSDENLLTLFNPSNQYRYCLVKDKCFSGSAPTISQVRTAFSEKTAESWLEIQLNDLSEFAGVRDKMDIGQIEETARTIILNFSFLKITELMYFFQLFKSGRFGKFYGIVDGLLITTAIREFLAIRNEELNRIESEERERAKKNELEKSAKDAISYEEYLKRKK